HAAVAVLRGEVAVHEDQVVVGGDPLDREPAVRHLGPEPGDEVDQRLAAVGQVGGVLDQVLGEEAVGLVELALVPDRGEVVGDQLLVVLGHRGFSVRRVSVVPGGQELDGAGTGCSAGAGAAGALVPRPDSTCAPAAASSSSRASAGISVAPTGGRK